MNTVSIQRQLINTVSLHFREHEWCVSHERRSQIRLARHMLFIENLLQFVSNLFIAEMLQFISNFIYYNGEERQKEKPMIEFIYNGVKIIKKKGIQNKNNAKEKAVPDI